MITPAKLVISAAFAAVALTTLAPSAQARPGQQSLVIVDGDRGRVVYDDGRDDGACVFRRYFAGYDWYGRPIWRKRYQCF